jgi:methylglutaconyl-CoA hydratase
MNGSVLSIERPDAATAILTLNRPQRRNALTMELMEALCLAMESLAAEPSRRAVMLCGAGPVFCAGLDLHEAADIAIAEQSGRWVARTFQTVSDSPLLTIAAAHGAAYAGGAGLMACCDLVVAAADLRVCFPEVRRGLVPALAAAVVRPRLRDGGLRELLLLADPIDAPRALSLGLVDRIVPGEQLRAAAQAVAAAALKGGPRAIRQTKRLLRELETVDRRQWMTRAAEFHNQARLGAEAHEGLAAFDEHRQPNWSSATE